MDKNIQLVGIVLLYLVGLNGSEDILGKKRAKLSIRETTILLISWLAQAGKSKLCITSLNSHSRPWESSTECGRCM